jgi:hypothetical protein
MGKSSLRNWNQLFEIASAFAIWITDAHRGDGRRFVARADEKLTAFVELESSDSCALE